MRPTTKIRPVGIVPRQSPNNVAVYATVICEDEHGVQWGFTTTSFVGDLKRYSDKQEKLFDSWLRDVANAYRDTGTYRYFDDANFSRDWLLDVYLAGWNAKRTAEYAAACETAPYYRR